MVLAAEKELSQKSGENVLQIPKGKETITNSEMSVHAEVENSLDILNKISSGCCASCCQKRVVGLQNFRSMIICKFKKLFSQ